MSEAKLIRNVHKGKIWTGSGPIAPGEIAECDADIADQLVASGLAETMTAAEAKKAAAAEAKAEAEGAGDDAA